MSNGFIIGAFATVAVVGIGGSAAYTYGTEGSTQITVTDKERIVETDGETTTSKYLVFGRDAHNNTQVFENTDSLLRGKFNSSTIQGQLVQGCTYEVDHFGWRSGFFSMYPNIYDAREISCSPTASAMYR